MTTNTTVLITGATQGLGAETAARLAARGWTVWLGARDAAAGEAVAEQHPGRQTRTPTCASCSWT